MSPLCRRVLWFLIGLCVLTYGVAAFTSHFGSDESQMMVVASEMNRGQMLYVDVWDNHGPLPNYVAAVLLQLWGESHSVYYGGRALMLLLFLASLFVFYRMVREMAGEDFWLAPMALWGLVLSRLYLKSAVEFRADTYLTLFWALGLWFWTRGFKRERRLEYLWAGVFVGLGFLVSFKTLLLGATCGVFFVAGSLLRRRLLWRELMLFGLGSLAGPLLIVVTLGAVGNLGAFWESYVGQNVDREPVSMGDALGEYLRWTNWAFFLLVACGFGLVQWARRQLLPGLIVLLWGALFYLMLFLLVLPTHYPQSIVPFVYMATPLLGALLLWLGRQAGRRLRATQKWAVVALALVTALTLNERDWWEGNLAREVRERNEKLDWIPADAVVLDGFWGPLFRARAIPYVALVNTIRARMRAGIIGQDLPARLAGADLDFAYWDNRVRDLPEPVLVFLRRNMLPTRRGMCLCAGQRLEKRRAAPVRVEVALAGEYFWRLSPRAEGLTLNGAAAPNPVWLEDGTHSMDWAGTGTLCLSRVPPEMLEDDAILNVWTDLSVRFEKPRAMKRFEDTLKEKARD